MFKSFFQLYVCLKIRGEVPVTSGTQQFHVVLSQASLHIRPGWFALPHRGYEWLDLGRRHDR